MKNFYIVFFIGGQFIYGQVGVNTNNPQKALHLAGTSETLRIESLNAVNNPLNLGDFNLDGNMENDTYPLYVDEYGDFSLIQKTVINSEDLEAFNDTSLPTQGVALATNNTAGKDSIMIKTFTIKVNRPSIIQIKYNISFDIYKNSNENILIDEFARRVSNFITLSPQGLPVTNATRHYGPSSKVYSSGHLESVAGPFYNGATTYITIPTSGEWDITFWGLVSSNKRARNGSYPTVALETYVKFAAGYNYLFFRKY